MTNPADGKARAVAAIEQAMADLDNALAELDRLPAVDSSTINLVTQALSSYVTVTDATLALAMEALDGRASPEVKSWLGSLRHAATLMQHTIGRLLNRTAPTDVPLKFEYVQMAVLMQRACDYYRRRVTGSPLEIVCRSVGDVPLAWADRVAAAAVADRLLSNAVEVSAPGGTIEVQILAGPGSVVCTVLDAGPTLTSLEQSRLFDSDAIARMEPGPARAARFGLIIAKELVSRMRGRLWSDSEPDKGTCISFRLPYHGDDSERARDPQ
jgi:signal transduction histidine kinase